MFLADQTDPALNLMILDDSEADILIMSRVLQKSFPNARVVPVKSANQAEAILEMEPFDCLILDYNMPDIDGLAFGKRLRGNHAFMPIVLITSVGDEILAAQTIRNGLSDYIPKAHINPSSLRRTISRAVQIAQQNRTIAEQKAELETFAYALAHDFKQPMRQIITFSDMLSQHLQDDVAEVPKRYLDFLRSAATRLGSLVDVMSEYTLLGNRPTLHPVDMDLVVRHTIATLAQYIEERHAAVTCAGIPMVYGNETLMRQGVQNLVVNGLKYNESPAPTIRVEATQEGGRCTISVIDNGIGIESEYLTEIFKPMKRLHTAAEYQGTGLGLTLARKAVLVQGGQIWCESEPGVGSTFRIQMPLWQQDEGEAAVAAAAAELSE
jgi:signal transduction histidine kinase